ncbi:hypothetical protein B0H13DRAFT_1903145 [Mycena leptocephala]|nr:hypothetical protein B0H13DRAFT_1903145 [Mycena leptocephala]
MKTIAREAQNQLGASINLFGARFCVRITRGVAQRDSHEQGALYRGARVVWERQEGLMVATKSSGGGIFWPFHAAQPFMTLAWIYFRQRQRLYLAGASGGGCAHRVPMDGVRGWGVQQRGTWHDCTQTATFNAAAAFMCAPSGGGQGWAAAFAAWRWLGAPLGANECEHSVKPWGSKVAAAGSGALQNFAAAFEAASAGFLEIFLARSYHYTGRVKRATVPLCLQEAAGVEVATNGGERGGTEVLDVRMGAIKA